MKNRGMLLESIINKTIKKYKKDDLAIIHKKEIPIRFGNVKHAGNKIKAGNVKAEKIILHFRLHKH